MDILSFFPSWFLPITLLVFFPFIFKYIFGRKSSIKLPPGPRRLPIIGNLHQVFGNEGVHQTLWNLSQKYGPAMLLHFGSQPFVVISSSEIAVEVLKTHDLKLCTRPYTESGKKLSFDHMDVAFSPHGDHWRDMRKVLVSEFLGAKRIRLYKNVMEVEMEALTRTISLHSLNTTINLEDMLLSLVYDVVCKVTFGKSYRGESFKGRTLKDIVDETLVTTGASFSFIFPTVGWILDELTGWNRRVDKCFNDLDGFLQMVLDDHLTKTSDLDHNDFVDDCKSRLTKEELKGLVMNVLEGAIDTSTITTVWAMSEIVKNPRIMQKLQNEIRSCVGSGKSSVNESDVTKMTYLKMVVKETLRLHPPAAFLMGRECMTQCQIGGYDVLPGMKVMVSAWGIGRDPRIWKENPTEFHPERFENMEIQNFEMIPFGGGRRACPGNNMATSTVEFVIANLLYLFHWKIPGGDLDMKLHGFPFLRRTTPLCLVPTKHI